MLTRDFLQKADCRTSFGCIEEALLLTPQQRAASLEKILACRPDGSPVWIFGYGSLMWNPVFDAEETCLATLYGWHRAFCLRLTAGRGTVNQPGRMLALKPGGETIGLAFRLPEASLREDLELLWKREMLTGCYRPLWCELHQQNGDTVTALVFVSESEHPLIEQDTCIQKIAPLIAQASGPLGTNAQYLFALEQVLHNHGMADEDLSELAKRVRALQQQCGQ
ncbi:cation transport protein ChaC|uniref:glutathione-specific gamma-glutamylcyclotransferase n=1 Tax=Brenneria salicis ATCC 15712 = DSM 30166 TaxID=714314 RepID=A0A366I8M6_9GAMM|nr:gamma-glutamylcyclotransferase [Brenneria salicis]NMN91809.1 cation transport protein ChaC [Brenneria salicis ATCC 15712 = DSM 30166]RBP65876.1 cation transport protein ChaC [Brenneria salicis ATCC 15712 = DSM 30166]RLM31906.1 transporter [Brenneria salicis ATCC 15712 = DSM 30166]